MLLQIKDMNDNANSKCELGNLLCYFWAKFSLNIIFNLLLVWSLCNLGVGLILGWSLEGVDHVQMSLQVAASILELIPLVLPLNRTWFGWMISDALRASLFSTADIVYQIAHGLDALFCGDFKKHPYKAQAEWALVFRLFAAAQLALARSSKFNFHLAGSLWGSTRSPRSPTIEGLDLCVDGWLAYELLSSPSAIRVMTDLLGDGRNEVDEDDDEDGDGRNEVDDEDYDDEDGDDGDIGFGRTVRLSGVRTL
jgi:hypothetical protein